MTDRELIMEMVEKARAAQKEFETFSQEKVDLSWPAYIC